MNLSEVIIKSPHFLIGSGNLFKFNGRLDEVIFTNDQDKCLDKPDKDYLHEILQMVGWTTNGIIKLGYASHSPLENVGRYRWTLTNPSIGRGNTKEDFAVRPWLKLIFPETADIIDKIIYFSLPPDRPRKR